MRIRKTDLARAPYPAGGGNAIRLMRAGSEPQASIHRGVQACPGAFRHLSTPECRCYEARVRTDHPPPARKSTETRDLPELFLPPPFDAAALRAVILGPGAPPLPARPAWLEGYALRADADALRVALVPDSGGRVAGVLVSLPPAARDRFDFALAVTRRARGPGAGRDGRRHGGRRSLRLRRGRRARGALARRALPGGAPRALCRGAGRSDGPLYPTRCERGASAPSRHRHPRARPHARRGGQGAGRARISFRRRRRGADHPPVLLRPLLRDGGAPTPAPPLRRDDVGGDRPRRLHQRRRDHRPAVRPAGRYRPPDRAVSCRAARPPRPAALEPRDRGRALRQVRAAGGHRPPRGAR